jgi:hypothetical protein
MCISRSKKLSLNSSDYFSLIPKEKIKFLFIPTSKNYNKKIIDLGWSN